MLWVTILAVFIVYFLWKAYGEEDPLDKLPGPKKWPIVGDAIHLAMLTQVAYFARVRQYVELYGDRFVFKIFHQRVLNILTPKDAEVVLSHSRNISKSRHYRFMQPWLGTGLLLSTGSKWHRRRKLLTPSFHFNILKSFTLVMEERSRALVRQLRDHPGEVEVASLIKDFTLYTICETAMGISLDLDKSQAAIDYLDAVINIGPLILERNLSFWLQFDFIYDRLPVGKRFQNYLRVIHSFADKTISKKKQQRRRDLEETKDLKLEIIEGERFQNKMAFLDLLLEVESRGEIDLEGIREEVNTFMFEGHDTTATALIFGIMLLADHPEVQDKIREEYRHVIGGLDRPFTMYDFAEMRYLETVIKETLRLYPSVPFIGRTITEDFMLGTLPQIMKTVEFLHRFSPTAIPSREAWADIPMSAHATALRINIITHTQNLLVRAGTQVAVRIYDLQRRADLFADPHAFKPERFLGPDQEPYAFVPFSAGPRNCIGQRFAMMEMKCVLGMICDNFRVEPKIPHFQPTLVADLILRTIDPIYVKFVPR